MSEPSRGFGYWLHIVADLTVVGGIVFLGIQIRQNSQMMRAQTRHELATQVDDMLTLGITDTAYTRVMIEGGSGAELSTVQSYQFTRTLWSCPGSVDG